ncbi:MAG: hypothetical protein FRX48_00571 [Lasallia pustulata]|uniref:Probable 26S proteasome regulatory subunit p27 n=1 Tax=Lasallia pustulata TaxID=136370 RepID=A0A5M8Q3U0_9LECA|nr:MAG: hypothetical protein FRX48_00571 [Lasallia pustulata]
MGLPMEDIHTPMVPSGPTSRYGSANGDKHDRLSLLDLIAEKDRVEAELSALGSVLDSHGVNMNTTLTTFDGYPRDDLDIAQIRTTRARIIHLRNDYKGLMSRIEAGLHAHHAEAQRASPLPAPISSQRTTTGATSNAADTGLVEAPFARVNSVVAGSPADDAGLRAGDRIRRFGSVDWINHEKLSKVAEIVQRNEGRSIIVKVVRIVGESPASQELQLTLVPRRNWGGRGMLGCHLLQV